MAILHYGNSHAMYDLHEIAVSDEERESAYDDVETKIVESLIEAHARIERFHELQKPRDLWLQEMEPGIVLGVKTTALEPYRYLCARWPCTLPLICTHVCSAGKSGRSP